MARTKVPTLVPQTSSRRHRCLLLKVVDALLTNRADEHQVHVMDSCYVFVCLFIYLYVLCVVCLCFCICAMLVLVLFCVIVFVFCCVYVYNCVCV